MLVIVGKIIQFSMLMCYKKGQTNSKPVQLNRTHKHVYLDSQQTSRCQLINTRKISLWLT